MFMRKQYPSQNLFKISVPERGFFVKNENNSVCQPSLFNQPRANSLKARLSFIMIPLKMAEHFSIVFDGDWRVSSTRTLKKNSQDKCMQYFIDFICTEKWVGCKHFKSYIFEVFVDKHGQVAGDSMTHSCWSSGGSRLLMKALHYYLQCGASSFKITYISKTQSLNI